MKNDCVFCKIVNDEIPAMRIWEDGKYMAFLDITPINPGHILVVPKKHSDYVFDLSDSEYAELMLKTKAVAKLLKNKLNCKKVGVIVEGFAIPHVHVHLVPINRSGELNPGRAVRAEENELKKILMRLKK